MEPTLPRECEIEILPLAGEPRLGQLIVFALGNVLVAHRLVHRRKGCWITQGDNRRGPDSPLQAGQVLGFVAVARAGGRQVWPRRGENARTLRWLARYHALRPARWLLRRIR